MVVAGNSHLLAFMAFTMLQLSLCIFFAFIKALTIMGWEFLVTLHFKTMQHVSIALCTWCA